MVKTKKASNRKKVRKSGVAAVGKSVGPERIVGKSGVAAVGKSVGPERIVLIFLSLVFGAGVIYLLWPPAPGTPGTPAPGTPAPGTPAPGTPAPGTPAPGTPDTPPAPGTPAPGTPGTPRNVWLIAGITGGVLLFIIAWLFSAYNRSKRQEVGTDANQIKENIAAPPSGQKLQNVIAAPPSTQATDANKKKENNAASQKPPSKIQDFLRNEAAASQKPPSKIQDFLRNEAINKELKELRQIVDDALNELKEVEAEHKNASVRQLKEIFKQKQAYVAKFKKKSNYKDRSLFEEPIQEGNFT